MNFFTITNEHLEAGYAMKSSFILSQLEEGKASRVVRDIVRVLLNSAEIQQVNSRYSDQEVKDAVKLLNELING